jgi:hypothetical protein
VVSNDELAACVEAGFIVIEETDLPITHSAAELGVQVAQKDEPEEAPEEEAGDGDVSDGDGDGDGDGSEESGEGESGDSPEDVGSSKNAMAKEAIAKIAELESAEDVVAYVDGDERSTVQGAADARVEALS